jgi:hypothetical protein
VGAAVGKAGLIDCDAILNERVVDSNRCFLDFLARTVKQFNVAFKVLGLACCVMFDTELLQCNAEGQVLHQITIAYIQKNHVRAGAFRNLYAAPERGVGR